MTHTASLLSDLPKIASKPSSSKARLSFVRTHTKAQSKAGMATAKKLMKLVRSSGKTVSSVTIAPDGAISVTMTDAAQSVAVASNLWDAELE